MKKSFSWRKFNIANTLSALWHFLLIILVGFILVVLFKGIRQEGVTIQAFQLPKHLVESGLNGQVFGMRIRDRVERIKVEVNSLKEDSTSLDAQLKPDLNLEVLGVGFSTNNMMYHLADLFGVQNHTISGDLSDIDKILELNLRGPDFVSKTIIQKYDQIALSEALDSLILKAALVVLEHSDPYRLAVYYYKTNQDQKSLQVIREMIDGDHPDKHWAYLALGNLHDRQGKREAAIEDHLKAIEISPGFQLAHKNLGWNYYQMQQYEKAIEHFQAANEAGADFSINNGLASSYSQIGELDKADAMYRKNVDAYPDLLFSYGNYASFLMTRKLDTVAAANLFQEAATKVTLNADYYNSIGAYHIMLGQIDSAELLLGKALDFDPNNVITLQALAQLYEGPNNDAIKSEHYLKEYIKQIKLQKYEEGMLQSALNRLAMNDYEHGRFDSALVHVQQAIDVAPDIGYPYSTLAETYAFMGNKSGFYSALESAVERGFRVEPYVDQEPYVRYKNEERFKRLISNDFKN